MIIKDSAGNEVEVTVTGGEISEKEAKAYVDRGEEQNTAGRRLTAVDVNLDGDEVDLGYHFEARPFERIRRITGYLVGAMNKWNDAKKAEEHDRVKHGTQA